MECLEQLTQIDGLVPTTLKIRALLRLGQLEQAAKQAGIGEAFLPLADSCDEKALFCCWAARVYDRSGITTRADYFVSASRGYALCSNNPDVWAQVNYMSALIVSGRDAEVDVDDLLAPALASASHRIRAQALEWKSILQARRGDRAQQAFLSEESWKAISVNPKQDQFLAANSLFNSANLAFELCDRSILSQIAARMSLIDWTDGLALQRFHVMRLAAWGRALDGDHLGAFALWRESTTIAPSAAWKVFAYLDRAYLAREMGEQLFAREELSHALALGETVRWEETTDQERFVLLWLAEGAAFADPIIAQSLLERYMAAKSSLPSHLQLSLDPLAEAPESYTAGVILKATNKEMAATQRFKRAFDLWSAAGYRWRASQAAVRLLEIGEATREQREYLAEHAPLFPNSWIASRARILLNDPYEAKDGLACQGS
jgi:hypothetical protein